MGARLDVDAVIVGAGFAGPYSVNIGSLTSFINEG